MWGHCELEIELDEPDRQFQPGDEVTGRVHVDVDKDCDCDALELVGQWKTHGRGSEATGREHRSVLFTGTWQGGEHHSYPFRFEIPNGPCSYHGHYINVDWILEARADIPWAVDPSTEREFIVEPFRADDHAYRTGNPESSDHTNPEGRDRRYEKGIGNIGAWIVSIGALLLGALLLVGTVGSRSPVRAVVGLATLGFGGYLLYAGVLRNWLAEKKVGEVRAELDESTVPAGTATELSVTIPPASDARVNEVAVTTEGWEKVRYDSGTDTRTKTHTFFTDDDIIAESIDRNFDPGEGAQFDHQIEIPDRAPASFYAYRNKILWKVTVHVDIDGWPDWKRDLALDVIPSVDRQLGETTADDEYFPASETSVETETEEEFESTADDEGSEPVW